VPIEVLVVDDQEEHPVEVERWAALASAALGEVGLSGDVELSVHFVDEERIAELNEGYLGHPGATDVLSFPIEGEPLAPGSPGGVPLLLGDIVICPAVAAANAPEHAGTYEAELALLVVHGVLHLCGMDHEADAEAEVMEAREQELLALHFRAGGPT